MTPEERALLLATAFHTAKILAETGFQADAEDLYAGACNVETAAKERDNKK